MPKKFFTKENLIIQQCIDLLKREDLKYELKMFLEPIINMLFNIINPYIYIFLGINVLVLILLIAILILLVFTVRNNKLGI